MEGNNNHTQEATKTEASVNVQPIQHTKQNQPHFPTWALISVLIVAFFILKSFIYISDKKRQGK